MEFTPFSEFYPEIRIDIPEAPVPTINRAIRFAARELCVAGRALRRELDSLTPVENITEYEFDLNSAVQIIAITKVKLNEREIRTPTDFIHRGDGFLELTKRPSKTTPNGMRIWARLAPTRKATYLETRFLEDYFDTLRDGIFAELYRMPGKPWYNPGMANDFKTAFYSRISEVRSREERENISRDSLCEYGGL